MQRLLSNSAHIDHNLISKVARENTVSPMMAATLCVRGLVEQHAVQLFLHPSLSQLHDPYLLPDMEAAVTRIRLALSAGERIAVYGDYDVDGIAATAMLVRYLSALGADVTYHIPSRHSEGYGMNEAAVRALAEDGVRLIITVDNGISAKPEIAIAYELGMEVIVTDHHQCPEELPACCAVIDAERKDSAYPYPKLCGTGVALKLVQALGCDMLRPYLALAALATVADVVPLRDENRVIVAEGLKSIALIPGLMALLSISGNSENTADSETLLFRIAPRLNAAGRMGNAARGVALLLAETREAAMPIAQELNEENEKRQAEEQAILKSAYSQLADYDLARNKAILLYSPGWNPGVIGIVASRLVEAYHRPVILFSQAEDCLTGSGRSIPGVNLYECLSAFSERFLKYGGHAQAAGLTLALEQFPSFFTDFNAHLSERHPEDVFIPTRYFDMEAEIRDLTMGLADEFSQLAPFGEGNPQPLFCARRVGLQSLRRVGKTNTHLQARAAQRGWYAPAVAFGMGKQAEALAQGECFDILFMPSINEFRGNSTVQLQMKCIKDVSFFASEEYLSRHADNFYDAFFRNVMYTSNRGVCHCTVSVSEADARLLEAIKQSCYGTLVLCASPMEAARLRALLQEQGLEQAIDARWSRNQQDGVNTLVLAPEPGLSTTGCRNLFYYGFSGLCPEDDNCCTAVLPGSSIEAFCRPMTASRENAKRYFQAFCAGLQAGPVHYGDLLFQAEALGTKSEGLLWLAVFTQLGFFRGDAQTQTVTRLENCDNRQLEESWIYSAAAAANTIESK